MATEKAKRKDERGLFQRGQRWYLRVYVKGQGRKTIALKPDKESRATTNKETARQLAREQHQKLLETGASLASQTGRQRRTLGNELLDSRVSHASQIGRMLGCFYDGGSLLPYV
jgi:hypothetical protein